MFEGAGGSCSQAEMFLDRKLPAEVAIKHLIRARTALQSGLAVYLCGDIPWQGRNSTSGRLLGREQRFLAIWARLAALTRSPVFYVFCTYLPGGRYRLELESVGRVQAGEESDAIADYLKQLDARIANEPAQAVAHLLWPCFNPIATTSKAMRKPTVAMDRPSRRNPATSR
jgi:lauroyl/myristoyl acyltransferase